MKILLGTPEYQPYHVGGGGEVYKQLAENYKKLGNEVVVVYGYYPTNSWGEEIKEYTQDGIKFYQIPEIPYPKSMPFLRTVMPPNPKSWFKLKAIIKKENPDVAHLHGYGFLLVNKLAKILKKQKVKYIFTLHGYPETQNKKNFFIRLIWKLYIRFVMNKTIKDSKRLTGISNYITKDFRNICKNKSITIFNGINLKDYEHTLKNINIRKKHKIDDKTLVIFSLGRLSEMKGFQEVIKLLPKFQERKIKVKYLIAGEDDGYKKDLIKLIKGLNQKDNVEFLGFLDLETKKQYLEQCNILAIPSLWEPFGLVALEGIIYNKLILTTETGGLKEVLKNYPKKVNIYKKDFINQIKSKKLIQPATNLNRFDWGNITKDYLKELK